MSLGLIYSLCRLLRRNLLLPLPLRTSTCAGAGRLRCNQVEGSLALVHCCLPAMLLLRLFLLLLLFTLQWS